MSEIRHRDPILDPPRRRKRNPGLVVGVLFSIVLWSGLVIYLKNSKFNLKLPTFNEEKVKVQLEKLPPPPPPPPPPPKQAPPPPPKLQPREVPPPPVAVPAPPPLEFKPVKKEDRKEYTGPVVATPAPPPPPAPPNPIISNPHWIRLPDTSDLDRYYPTAAKERGTEGRATIECTVTAQGTLTDCVVISEEPAGAGFGDATKRVASRFKMAPKTIDGAPVSGGKVRVPLRWQLSKE